MPLGPPLVMLLLAARALATNEVQPPPELRPWLQYARALDPNQGCPGELACVHLNHVEVAGRASAGRLNLTFSGSNLGRLPASVVLIQPATTWSLVQPKFSRGAGALRLGAADDDVWEAMVEPGTFTLSVEAHFDPAPNVPLQLADAIAQLTDHLTDGALLADAGSSGHGGSLVLQAEAEPVRSDDLTLQASRAITYGSVVTFTYRFVVVGLREPTRMLLPTLGHEQIEGVEPAVGYTQDDDGAIAVTLAPGSPEVRFVGHFDAVPSVLTKPARIPFESWLFNADARHPVRLSCDGTEVDPTEVRGLEARPDSRAFVLTGEQALTLTPMEVAIEQPHAGAADAQITFSQGSDDAWLGNLSLHITTAPPTDRLVVPTPALPHYAEVGRRAVRLFTASGPAQTPSLSLRIASAGNHAAPLGVQWRSREAANPVVSRLKLALPGQAIRLDSAHVHVNLLPGYVPLAVLGASDAAGTLLEGVQIYAILFGLLGVALARAARLPRWAVLALGILLTGLYSVDAFPGGRIVALLVGCVVLRRLPEATLQHLRDRRRWHRAVAWLWAFVVVSTLVPAALFMQERLLSAMHPWSVAMPAAPGSGSSLADGAGGGAPGAAPPLQAAPDLREEEAAAPEPQRRRNKADIAPGSSFSRGSLAAAPVSPPPPPAPAGPADKSVRPVAFSDLTLPAVGLDYQFGSLVVDEPASASIILVGPWLRALWLIAESLAVAATLGLMLRASGPLWFAPRREAT